MLEARVQILRVLANDDEIDVFEARAYVWEVGDRTQVRVQIQRLSQPDIHAREAFADRCRHRPLQSDSIASDRREQCLRQRRAMLFDCDNACVMALPFHVDAGRFDDADNGIGDFGSDPVAWNESNGVAHAARVPSRASQKRSARPPMAVSARS